MSPLRVGSLFSGVEGIGMGLEAAGFEVAWQVEIDRDAVSVLERHYPDTPRIRDVREAGAHNLTPVDVIAFGSPCQGFSVAGRGDGLTDARSGLFGEAIRIIRELRPAVAVWENVCGAFSANGGRDFGAVLAALADAGALDIAWRVLDARWFGVAQRRRRIFLVADFGGERAASVLFEPEGGGRDPEARRAPQEGAPGGAADGARVVGWKESQSGTRFSDDVGTLDANYGSRREDDENLVAVAYTVHGEHSTAMTGNGNACVAFPTETARNLDSTGGYATNQGGTVVAVTENQRSEVLETPYANAVATSGGKIGQGYQAVRAGMAVRRLTPRECERLMGWEDDRTRYRADGSEVPDGVRYRLIGNGVVAPVAEWLGRRLRAAMEGT